MYKDRKKEKDGNLLSGTGNRGMKASWSACSPVLDCLLDYRTTHIGHTCLGRVITSVSPDLAIEQLHDIRRMIRARLHWVDAYKMDSPCICELSDANRRLGSGPCMQL